jgi:nicotinamide-nucleotide amidase
LHPPAVTVDTSSIVTESVSAIIQSIAAHLLRRGERVATAESCTGGLVAKLMTDLAGSSAWFERGVVSYSNDAKHDLLGVPRSIFDTDGAVSRSCVLAMAEGLLRHSPADWAVAITGIAGPGGGTPGKPVGTVWMAWARRGTPAEAATAVFPGDRDAVRQQTAERVLRRLDERLAASP